MTTHGEMLGESQIRGTAVFRRVGRRIYCLDETVSTMDDAMALAVRDGPQADGAVVFAENQTAGRGQRGRVWHSPRGRSVQCSVVLCEFPVAEQAWLSIVAGLCVCEAIEFATHLSPRVRWPNDVYVNGRKIAGVLVERRYYPGGAATIVGIGINCRQRWEQFDSSIRERATSLELESSLPIDRAGIARSLLTALDAALTRPFEAGEIRRAFAQRSEDVGMRVSVRNGEQIVSGRIVDLAPDAGLLLETDAGQRIFVDAAMAGILERHRPEIA